MKTVKLISPIVALVILLSASAFTTVYVKNLNNKKMKTFVLVHGAWAGKYAWDKVKPQLEKNGSKVVTLDLPGHGDDQTPIKGITLQSYVDAVINVIKKQEGKVILVGHSMGGMVITQVAEAIPDRIEKLVYLSAYLPANGQSIQDLSGIDANSLIGPNLVFASDYSFATIKPEFVVKVFAEDCSEAVKKMVLEKHKGEPLAPFQDKVVITDANFGAIPKYYIETTKDVGVSTANQERMIASGNVKRVFKLESGHSPYFAKPQELVTILETL